MYEKMSGEIFTERKIAKISHSDFKVENAAVRNKNGQEKIYQAKNIKKSFNPEKKEFILSIMLGFILMNILQQYAVVILDNWPVLLGRYLHGSLIAISVILTILLSSFLRNKLMFNLTCSALSIILVFFNAIYLLIVIQKF